MTESTPQLRPPRPRLAGRTAGIRGRLTAVMLLSIAPLVGGILGIGYLAGDRVRLQAERELGEEAAQCGRAVGRWEAGILRAVRHVQALPVARDGTPDAIRDALGHVGALYEQATRVHVVGPDGRNVARSDALPPRDYADRDWFRRALAGEYPARQAVAVSRTFGGPTVTYAGPVRSASGRVVGVAAASTDLPTLAAQVKCDRIGRTGYTFVVDEGGHLLAHPDPARLATLTSLADHPAVRRATAPATGHRGGGGGDATRGGAFRFADASGTEWLSNAVPIGNGWTAVAVRQRAEVDGLARLTLLGAAAVAAVGILAAAGLTYVAVGRWVRPVRALTAAAERLSAGAWGSAVPVRVAPSGRTDELGVLAGAFNRMSRELADAHDRLRRRAEDAERRTADAEQRYRDIVAHAPIGIYQTSADGRYLSANARLALIYGYGSADALTRGLTDIAAQLYVDPDTRAEFQRLIARDGAVTDFQARVRRLDGAVRWIAEDARAVRGPDGGVLYYEGTVQDITDRRDAEHRLRHDALHDGLTGLLNRAAFERGVAACLRRAAAAPGGGRTFAVLFLDLDRFKLINDSLGHPVGDRLLVAVAGRIEACLADPVPADGVAAGGGAAPGLLGRLGGDEFAVLLGDVTGPADAVAVADRIRAALARPFELDGQEIVTGTSVGIAVGHPGYASPKDVIRDADAAMYRAKTEGRGRHALFDATMHDAAVRRLRLESDLRRAAGRGELFLAYQPVVSLETRRVVGFEALVRWRHPADGVLLPADFLPAAEDCGLSVPVGQWAVREACRQAAAWRAACPGLPAFAVAVNLTRRQFRDPGLVRSVADALADHKTDPAALKLEVTEAAVAADGRGTDDPLVTLRRIRDLGVGVYLDEFGTGQSSLGCLHRFPIEGLKIDPSFVRNMSDRRDLAAVVQAVVTLAHNTGIRVVAEGLETIDQVAMLQALECDDGQGFHFAHPLSPDEAAAFLLAGPPAAGDLAA